MKRPETRPAGRPATKPVTAQGARPAKPARAQPADRFASRRSMLGGIGIVPRQSVAGQSLAVTIAIMTFLASLTVCAVAMVHSAAARWQNDISSEVTIQIRPAEADAMVESMRAASRLALGFEGISRVTALDDATAAKLLEPWLGAGLDLKELPVPKLLIVTIDAGARPDLGALARALEENVPGAWLDDHRSWTSRLAGMAWATVGFGLGVLILVLAATVLTVIFATRGAMSGNHEIVDVLHTVGAKPEFIAQEFMGHFLVLALRGGLAGGVAAAAVFALLSLWAGWNRATPQGDQFAILFGSFSPGLAGYAGIAAVAISVSILVAMTSRMTVLAQLAALDHHRRR
jgi:cell division transport system permease protein